MAPTLADYSDVKTLEVRLKVVLNKTRHHNTSGAQRRRRHQQQQQQEQQCRQLLQQQLGMERFQEIEALVATIQQERTELVGASCSKCQYIRRLEGKTEAVPGAGSFGTELPREIKQLYFGTPLVTAWERACKVGKNHNQSMVTWEPMVQQTQAHLQAYYEWKAQNFVCQR